MSPGGVTDGTVTSKRMGESPEDQDTTVSCKSSVLRRHDKLTQVPRPICLVFRIPEAIAECVFILDVRSGGQGEGGGVTAIWLKAHDRHAVGAGADASLQVREGVAKL